MHTLSKIKRVADLYQGARVDLPDAPGVYAFWWVGDRSRLLNGSRQIVLKGPGGRPVSVEYKDWWPEELPFPCLYVGKSTSIRRRFSLHIMRGSTGRLHLPHVGYVKAKPKTTSCQLRWGIEHVFPDEADSLKLIVDSVGFSYRADFADNAIAERFFEEDRLVGTWRPWFNIDSER